MKKLLLTTALVLLTSPALAKDYTIKEVTNASGKQHYYFEPANLTIEIGDTVKFVDAQDSVHDIMFVSVPKGVNEMIMSPIHRKKGDTFSYTFKVAGTYKFHCHPHEALGMKGTLIVGKPSKAGETVMMDHHKMTKIHDDAMKKGGKDAKAASSDKNLPQGTAIVNTVDAAHHAITVTHDPIKALGWPKMKMLFNVDSSIDLSTLKAGDAISFTLKPQGKDDYIVISLKKTR